MTSIPRPGHAVRGSKSGAPIMALFDLLGRRWAMGIIWTLYEEGEATFRQLQERCESISPGVLNTRLKELKTAKLITHTGTGYSVTDLGQQLYDLLAPLGAFAKDWGQKLET